MFEKAYENLRSIPKFSWTRKTSGELSPNIKRTKRSSRRAVLRMQFSISRRARSKSPLSPSKARKAVVAVLGSDEFCGEGCLTGQPRRIATAVAMTKCEIMRLEKVAIVRVLLEEPAFSEMFIGHLLARTMRVEEDLIDQLFNSSEKRLARALLLLANFGKDGRPEQIICEGQPRDARGDDRPHAVSRQSLHE